MTTTSILNKVRRLLQDTESPYHWSDEQLKVDLQIAVRMLNKVRPETRYAPNLVDYVELPASASDDISIDGRFEDCLAYHTAYSAYSDDCTDSVSKALADDFLAKFNSFSQL